MIFLYAWETIAHYNSVGNPSADSFVPINPLGYSAAVNAATNHVTPRAGALREWR